MFFILCIFLIDNTDPVSHLLVMLSCEKCCFSAATFQQPVSLSYHKSRFCLCCKDGPISAAVNLPRSGFVPGEKIPIIFKVDNKSDSAVSDSKVELVQHITYTTLAGRLRYE